MGEEWEKREETRGEEAGGGGRQQESAWVGSQIGKRCTANIILQDTELCCGFFAA